MARKRKHRSGSRKLPLAVAVPVGIPIYNAIDSVMNKGGQGKDVLWHIMGYGTSGFNGAKVAEIGIPIVAGVLVHSIIGKRVNRMLPKWLPFGI